MMKNIWNSLFAGLLVFVWSAIPFGNAEANVSAATKLGEALRASFSTVRTAQGTSLVTRLLDSQGKTVHTLVSETTSRNLLTAYKPSTLSKMLREAAIKNAKAYPKGFSMARIMKDKLFQFPQESAAFFIALGAVMTYQLMFNEAQNPVSYQQLIQGQMDPVGQLAFYFFMVANGVATEPLMLAIQNGKLSKRLTRFVPFFGMGVGSVASNIVHELGHAPNLMQCAKTMVTMNGLDPACDKAIETWNDRGGAMGTLNEWGPGLISLLGSVVLSGAITSPFFKAAGAIKKHYALRGIVRVEIQLSKALVAKQVVKFAGIQVAASLVPGRAWAFGLTVLGHMTNIILFTKLEDLIRQPIAFAYHNWWDQGPALRDFERKMIADILRLKQTGWTPDPSKNPLKENSTEFEAALVQFQEMMPMWRQTNTAKILEAHSNWEQKITDLSLTYKGAYNFYRDFLGQYREKNLGEFKEMYAKGEVTSLLDMPSPLNGVKAPEVTDPVAYSTDPEMVQQVRIDTVKKTINQYNEGKLVSKTILGAMTQQEKSIMTEITTRMDTTNAITIGKAIDDLICVLYSRSDMTCKYPPVSMTNATLRPVAKALYSALGEPRPIWKKGPAYLEAFYQIPEHKVVDDTASMRGTYQAAWAPFSTNTLRDSLLASMVFGPDAEKGEQLIHDVTGFPSLFIPPRINNSPNALGRIKPIEPMMVPRIWDVPVIYEKDQQSIHYSKNDPSKVYANAYEYLMKVGIRPSLMTADPQVFEGWWSGYAETALVKAWVDYEEKYQNIIKDLVSALWKTDDSILNAGMISNGVMESIKQEYNLYLLVLGELLKDKLMATYQEIPAQLMSAPVPLNISNLPLRKDETDLYAFLRRDGNIDFSEIMRIQGVHIDESIRHDGKQHFLWQDFLLKDFSLMEGLLKQIKPVVIVRKGKQVTVTTTNLPSSMFQMAGMTSSDNLKMIKNELFTNGPTNKLGVQFSNFEQKIIEICFQGLMAVGSEIHNLGVISNAVSYVARSEGGLVTPRCVDKPQKGLVGVGMQSLQKRLAGCE